MTEIEVKILDIDRTAVEATLLAAGASLIFDGEMVADFWDDAAGSLTASKSLLRLRSEGDHSVLTFKQPLPTQDGTKVMRETETIVSDAAAMREILRSISFSPKKTTQKRRTTYSLAGVLVLIDVYGGDMSYIPPFVEIEADSAEKVYSTAAALGFSREACLNWNTYDLMQHYGR